MKARLHLIDLLRATTAIQLAVSNLSTRPCPTFSLTGMSEHSQHSSAIGEAQFCGNQSCTSQQWSWIINSWISLLDVVSHTSFYMYMDTVMCSKLLYCSWLSSVHLSSKSLAGYHQDISCKKIVGNKNQGFGSRGWKWDAHKTPSC